MPRLYFDSTRYADLPLHHGPVSPRLAARMTKFASAIVDAIVLEHGRSALLQRLSGPFWFQALGAIMGMDWHSSGITSSVMAALKKAVNPRFNELGIYICGGKGKHSRSTPDELVALAERTGLNGNALVRFSKLSAKVDNTAIQDGFQIYLHTFIVTNTGEWAVVQQGMDDLNGMARRYHWHSEKVKSFVESPHTFVYGMNRGAILNLTHPAAGLTKAGILHLIKENPIRMMADILKIAMHPGHHTLAENVNLKQLGSVLAIAHEKEIRDFESLLLLEGLGPRTLQSLTLVSEVIHGTPSRFSDPAHLFPIHGGQGAEPFGILTKEYKETIHHIIVLLEKAKIGDTEKIEAIKNLTLITQNLEKGFEPPGGAVKKIIGKEGSDISKYGNRTIFNKSDSSNAAQQLKLF